MKGASGETTSIDSWLVSEDYFAVLGVQPRLGRVFLPEEHLPGALKAGGWVAAYTPSIIQASQFVEAVRATGQYVQVETHEVLIRGWYIQGLAVRPEHEMVGHTGFVSVARWICAALEPGKQVRPT